MVLTAVEIYVAVPDEDSDSANLETLTLGGEEIEGFEPQHTQYAVTLPYGTEVPEVGAVAKDHGTVFVLPAITNQSAALIQVTSENGKVTRNYTVQFQETPAALVSAELRLEADEVHEDDIIPVYVDALLESGELADEDRLRVKYRVVDPGVPEKAVVSNGMLYAYWTGEIQLEADITLYEGSPVTSAPLTVIILPSETVYRGRHRRRPASKTGSYRTGTGQPGSPEYIPGNPAWHRSKASGVTWKKVSGASGYNLQYSKDSKFKKAVSKTVSNKTAYTIKKLKSRQKYYVRIRAYKNINGKKVYGSYSKNKAVKVK